MNRSLTIRFNTQNMPLILMLATCCSKWLFEQILAESLYEFVLLIVSFCLLLLCRSFKVRITSGEWLIYIASIAFSLLLNGFSVDKVGRAGIVALTAIFAILLDCDDFDVKKIVTLIFHTGVFHGIMVLIHFLLKGTFNSLYFPILSTNTRMYAEAYYRGGRYFGILASPHEVAGLITFAIIILFCRLLIKNEKSVKNFVLLAMMLIALFLTGKKGILAFAIVTVVLMVFILYASKKQWHKLFIALCVCVAGFFVLRYLILSNPDNPLFYRINVFITRLANGESADSSRTTLYQAAFALFERDPLFGIGWRHFKGLTVSEMGFTMAHEVNCDYLQWLCEMGIFGFILNMIPILMTLYRAIRICRSGLRKIEDSSTKSIVVFAIGVNFFTLMYAFIEVPFYDIMFFAVYIVSCIIISSAYKKMIRTGAILFGQPKTEASV